MLTPSQWLQTSGQGTGLPTLDSGSLISNVVSFLISGAVFLVIVLALLFLIWGGVMMIISAGEKEGMAKAKATITYALVGLALGIGSFIFLGILGNFLGVNLTGFYPISRHGIQP